MERLGSPDWMLVKAASYILSKINMRLLFFLFGKRCDFTFTATPWNGKVLFVSHPKVLNKVTLTVVLLTLWSEHDSSDLKNNENIPLKSRIFYGLTPHSDKAVNTPKKSRMGQSCKNTPKWKITVVSGLFGTRTQALGFCYIFVFLHLSKLLFSDHPVYTAGEFLLQVTIRGDYLYLHLKSK